MLNLETDDVTPAVLYYIQHMSVLISRQADQILQEQLGIGLSQFRILQTLQVNPSVRQKQIAGMLALTEASVSRQVKLMLDKGMLSVKINPENRREHLTVVSPKGARLLAAGERAISKQYASLMAGLKPKERTALLVLLAEVHKGMCKVDAADELLHAYEAHR